MRGQPNNMNNTTPTQWIKTADVAKIVRTILKKNFPGTKFTVRSDSYSGGSSINVGYTDGPNQESVESYVKHLQGCGFDGMIDLQYYHRHAMLTDGTIIMVGSEGTSGSGGVHNGWKDNMPDGAVEVHIGVSYLFVNRHVTPELRALMTEKVTAVIELNNKYDLQSYVYQNVERKFSAEQVKTLHYSMDANGWVSA